MSHCSNWDNSSLIWKALEQVHMALVTMSSLKRVQSMKAIRSAKNCVVIESKRWFPIVASRYLSNTGKMNVTAQDHVLCSVENYIIRNVCVCVCVCVVLKYKHTFQS